MYLPALIVQLPHKDIASPLGGAFVAAVLKTVVAGKCTARSFRREVKALMIRLVMTDASRSTELTDKAFSEKSKPSQGTPRLNS